ncbi:unnamed protein product [Orchesella dallaii]|uniref:RNA-directed DNA polymerase n=1 Tax=Orchesella dallaii TaxID=48710 RepID=A0ABP1RV57_9HEXA
MHFVAIMDTGSSFSLMTEKLAYVLKLQIRYNDTIDLLCANNTTLQTIGTAFLVIQIGHKEIAHNFHILKRLCVPCILGNDILTKYGIVMNQKRKFFYFGDSPLQRYKLSDASQKLTFVLQERKIDLNRPITCHIEKLIRSFPTVCRTDGIIGQTDIRLHKIDIDPDKSFKPIKEFVTYFPPNLATEIDRQIKDLLKHNLIRRSKSPFRFGIVLDDKKDGGIRMTINYKRLNSFTRDNATPMHNSNIILRLLPAGGVYSSIDLASGFWQIRLHPDSVEMTAFYANGVLYEWLVMPFGLKGAPATFVTLMNFVLRDYVMKFCFIYMDDVIVFSRTFDEHLVHLKLIFERLKEANLSINLKKSSFAQRQLEYLGHVISSDGVRKNPARMRAILNMSPPTDKQGIKRLQGMCAWLITFIPNFSTLFEPLSRLLSKKTQFVWGNEQQNAFNKLKQILSEDIVLQGLDYTFPIYLRTDASEVGIGACLCQEINGQERVVSYTSKTLSTAERKYNICEKECYAILFAIKKFKSFLWGQKFTVYTDNRALTYLKSMHDKSRNLTNWSQEIERWGCDIKFCPGKQNVVADCLSRAPAQPSADEPDHLVSSEERYMPIFALTFVNNILDRIREEQSRDDEIREIVRNLRLGVTRDSTLQNYSLQNNILHYAKPIVRATDEETDTVLPYNGEPSRISNTSVPVLPKSLQDEIMKYFHDDPHSGHFGVRKTKVAIEKRFFWKSMYKDIPNYVKSCDVCQKFKSENMKIRGLLGEVPLAKHVFETVYLDFIGPLQSSRSARNKYCLVLVDQLTSWVELKPMPCGTSKRVINFIEEIFCRFGFPKVILTDNASYFISNAMKQFCKEWGIKLRTSSAYHPQVNRSERTNKDLVRMIASYFSQQQNLWDCYLQYFALALRHHVNETRKVSPAEIMFGHNIMLPIDRALQPEMSPDYNSDAQQLASQLPFHMTRLIKYVRDNMVESHKKNKVTYDQKRRHFDFKQGEMVLVRNHQLSDASAGVSRKFLPKWIGPFKIVLKDNMTYVLEMPRKYCPKRHVSDLKPYTKRVETNSAPVPLRRVTLGLEAEVPVRRQLRPRKPIDYRVAAGYKPLNQS